MKTKVFKIFLILLFMFTTVKQLLHAQPAPAMDRNKPVNWDQRVFYEIFIRSFYDSNGDGVGDLNGITMKLGYLQKLGIGGIWITPFNPSPSYHKYDVTNYEEVDPQCGTLDDFKKLVKEAHKRNIVVLMDLVVNHTSHLHPWFQAAIKNDPQYRNYYIWKDNPTGTEKNWYPPRDANRKIIPGDNYFGFFSPFMPDLNYDNPYVRESIIDMGKWWLKETDVDGFRLDAAQHIFDADDTTDNNNWWKQFTDAMKQERPNVITVGEVWNDKEHIATYLNSLTGCFNFEFSWDILKSLKDETNDSLIEKLAATKKLYNKRSPDSHYMDPIFLSNHDGDRIMSLLGNNIEKAKLAAAIYLTLPGTPFLYYGEELGMMGAKPDTLIREPFPWNEKGKDDGQTHWENFVYNTPEKIKPLSLQEKDRASVYQVYKKLISLRISNPSLTSQTFAPVSTSEAALVVYTRGTDEKKLLVMHNLSAKAVNYSLPDPFASSKKLIFRSNSKIKKTSGTIILPPYSSTILAVK